MAARKGSKSTENDTAESGESEVDRVEAATIDEPATADAKSQADKEPVEPDADQPDTDDVYDPYGPDEDEDHLADGDGDRGGHAEVLDETHPAIHDDEQGHRSLSSTLLAILVGVLVVASLTLWAAPKLAPHLPAGVAQYLTPGQVETTGRLAELEEALAAERERTEAETAALRAEVAALAGKLGTGGEVAASAQAVAEAAAGDAAALADHLAAVDQEVQGLRSELTAISDALAKAGDGAGASSPELAAKLAAMGARLDSIAAGVEDGTGAQGLADQLSALAGRLDAVEAQAADAMSAQNEALGAVSTAIEEARLQAALDLLGSRLTGGLPFGAKLNEIAGMTGKAPPEALSAVAANGVATAVELEAGFSRNAHAAVVADAKAEGQGALGVFGWLQAQLAGRPVEEIEGDDVGAVTSRIGARIQDGDLAAAVAEAERLPEHAQSALGPWLKRLRNRVEAELALEAWRTELGAGG